MKKNTSILPDELFNEGFLSHEAEYDHASWEHMRTLLDKDDLNPVLPVPPPDKNNHYKTTLFILTIMTTLSIFSLATWMLLGTTNSHAGLDTRKDIRKTEILMNSAGKSDNNGNAAHDINSSKDRQNPGYSKSRSTLKRSGNPVASQNRQNKNSAGSLYREAVKSATDKHAGNTSSDNPGNDSISQNKPPFKDSVRMVTNEGKTYRIFTRMIWVPEEYEYINKPREKTVQDFWMGIHFTAQRPVIDTTNGYSPLRESAGFNWQFMSGNRLRHNSWAAYGGFDWGMQFYGQGKKSNVVLNNTTQDSGYTRLRTWSMDFLGRAHFEYAKFPIVPYFNAFAGPRIYSTGQLVSSYVPLKDNESNMTHNAHTSVSMMYGVGIGARLRLGPVISIDARYEIMSGTPVRLVDMDRSSFNGLSYDLAISKVKPTVEQFKFGIIFDISEGDYEKKLVKEGYYKQYMYDSLYVDPRDTNKIYLPCNCTPCDQNNSTQQQAKPYEENSPYNIPNSSGSRKNSSGSSGSGGSSKGSFPGIRPGGGSKPVIKN